MHKIIKIIKWPRYVLSASLQNLSNKNTFYCNHDRSNMMASKLFFVLNHSLKLFCVNGAYNEE